MRTRIVVVDDEEAMHVIFQSKFKSEVRNNDYIIESYMDGKECETALLSREDEQVDEILVIFSDINMPEMDGFELLEKIKAKYKSLEVVMISAYDDIDTVHKVKGLGANCLIPKPVDFDLLKLKIAEIHAMYSNDKKVG